VARPPAGTAAGNGRAGNPRRTAGRRPAAAAQLRLLWIGETISSGGDAMAVVADHAAFEVFLTSKLIGLPGVLRTTSHLTMKKVKTSD